MATIKTTNGHGHMKNDDARSKVINYIMQPKKAIHGYCGGNIDDFSQAADYMREVSEKAGKDDGVKIRHLIVSFAPYETRDPSVAYLVASSLSDYIGTLYPVVFAVHEDEPHIHFHMVFNAVSDVNGERYRGTRREFNAMRHHLNDALKNFGINTLQYIPSEK